MEFMNDNSPAAQHLSLKLHPFHQARTWLTVNVDPQHLNEIHELGERRARHLHVELRRFRIMVNLEDCHYGAFPVNIHIVGDYFGFICLDELDQLIHGHFKVLDLSLADFRAVYDNDWFRHRYPSLGRIQVFSYPTCRPIYPIYSSRVSSWGAVLESECSYSFYFHSQFSFPFKIILIIFHIFYVVYIT